MGHWHSLIRQELASEQQGGLDGAGHLTPQLLAAFAQRRLSRGVRRATAAHLAVCPTCRSAAVCAGVEVRLSRRVWLPQLSAATAALVVLALVGTARWLGPRPAAIYTPGATAQAMPAPARPVTTALSGPAAHPAARHARPGRAGQLARVARMPGSSSRRGLMAAKPLLPLPVPSVSGPATTVATAATSGFQDQPPLPTLAGIKTPVPPAKSVAVVSRTAAVDSNPDATPNDRPTLGAPAPAAVGSALAAQNGRAAALPEAAARRFSFRVSLFGQAPRATLPPPTSTSGFAAAAAPAASGFSAVVSPWRISQLGVLENSPDGQQWLEWKAAPIRHLDAVTALGARIWAAGNHAAIYFSADAGLHWTRLAQLPATAAIAIRSIQFDDLLHGSLLASDGQTWVSADGGRHWQRQ